MRVLVTGAAGSIGRVVTAGLKGSGHEVVALDRVRRFDGFEGHWHVADCADPVAVSTVFGSEPLDGVVHLAGHPDEANLADSITSHTVTTAALLEAMVEHSVNRFVYASSNHAVGQTPREPMVSIETRPRPDTFYGVGKVAAEALMSLYADRYGLDVVSCRIGSFGSQPQSVRQLSTWLSHDDCVRMVKASLTAPAPGYAVLYGISANTRAWWDLEPGRGLGYDPKDDAEDFLDSIPTSENDESEGERVGGAFTWGTYYRSAFGD